MATNRKYNVHFRRKREGKTDYKQRLNMLKSHKPRLVIRRSLSNVIVQLVSYEADGDKVLMTVRASDLKNYGLKVVNGNVPTSYLTGLLLGKKAKEAGFDLAIVDAGLQKLSHESRIFSVMKGVVEAGLDVHASDKHFPSDDRVSGKHIETYAQSLKDNKEVYAKQFKAYLDAKIQPESISSVFGEVKAKIMG